MTTEQLDELEKLANDPLCHLPLGYKAWDAIPELIRGNREMQKKIDELREALLLFTDNKSCRPFMESHCYEHDMSLPCLHGIARKALGL